MHEDVAFDTGGHDKRIDGMNQSRVDDRSMPWVRRGTVQSFENQRGPDQPLRWNRGVERSTGIYASEEGLPLVKASEAQ